MSILEAIKNAKPEDWIDAIYWFLITSIGGLMPIYGGFILLTLFSQQANLSVFSENGEFALYSASLLSSILYVVSRESGMNIVRGLKSIGAGEKSWRSLTTAFPTHRGIITISLLLIVASAFFFSGATIAHISGNALSLNVPLLQLFTLTIFAISIFMSFFVTLVDNYWDPGVNVGEAFQKEFKDLNKDFDQIAG